MVRPLLWNRLRIDTRKRTNEQLADLLEGPLWARTGHLVQRLVITVHTSETSLFRYKSLLVSIGQLIQRLPSLFLVHLTVSEDTPLISIDLVDSIQRATSQLSVLSIEWHRPLCDTQRSSLFEGIRRHSPALDSLTLCCDEATMLMHNELNIMSNVTELTLDRFEVDRQALDGYVPLSPFRRLTTLDVDASIEFLSLIGVLLPATPLLETLIFYLVFPTHSVDPVPSLAFLPHLRHLECRSVEIEEIRLCLTFFAPLTSVETLVLSATETALDGVTDTIYELLEPRLEQPEPVSRSGSDNGSAVTAFKGLRKLVLEWEGVEDELPVEGSEEVKAFEVKLDEMRSGFEARGVKVIAPVPDEAVEEVEDSEEGGVGEDGVHRNGMAENGIGGEEGNHKTRW